MRFRKVANSLFQTFILSMSPGQLLGVQSLVPDSPSMGGGLR